MISAWDCFHCACLELVRSTPIKQRLVSAYRRHLASLPEDQLPSDVREFFGQVMRSLGGVQPLRGEDAVAASVPRPILTFWALNLFLVFVCLAVIAVNRYVLHLPYPFSSPFLPFFHFNDFLSFPAASSR